MPRITKDMQTAAIRWLEYSCVKAEPVFNSISDEYSIQISINNVELELSTEEIEYRASLDTDALKQGIYND